MQRLSIGLLVIGGGAFFLVAAGAQAPGTYEQERQRALELLRATAPLVGKGPATTPVPVAATAPVTTTPIPVTPGVAPPPTAPVSATPAPTAPAPPAADPPTTSSTVPVNPTTPAKKLALLVGIDEYQNVNKLRGCVNDVRRMEHLLTSKFEFPKEDVLVLVNEQATYANIIKKFKEHLIARALPESIVVFHCSSHGSQIKDDGNEEIDGFDETIVPVDSRANNVFDITDDELNGLFKELAQKSKNITFVLDCCHSGAQFKDTALARQIAPDTRARPPAPPYAKAEPRPTRAVDERFEGREYALISGCAAKEVSFEFTDPATGLACGALTHFFVEEVSRSAPGKLTYRDVMDRVKANVTANYSSQHPQLEGRDADKFVFDDSSVLTESYVLVEPEVNNARVAHGAIHGLTVGSIFEVYPPGTKEFKAGQGVGTIELNRVEPNTALAAWTAANPLAPTSRGVLRQFGHGQQKLGVYLSGPEAGTSLAAIRQTLTGADAVSPEFASSPRYSDVFVVTQQPADARLLLQNMSAADFNKIPPALNSLPPLAGGAPDHLVLMLADGFVLTPPSPANDPASKQRVLEDLTRWAKWLQLLATNNPGTSKLKVTFDIRSAASREAREPLAAPDLTVRAGSELEMLVKNESDQPIYFTILDLDSTGGVGIVFPEDGVSQELAAGKPWMDKVPVLVPPGRRFNRDYLKVVVTAQPADFGFLRQPGRDIGGPIGTLFGRSANVQRLVGPVRTQKDDWTTALKVLEVVVP